MFPTTYFVTQMLGGEGIHNFRLRGDRFNLSFIPTNETTLVVGGLYMEVSSSQFDVCAGELTVFCDLSSDGNETEEELSDKMEDLIAIGAEKLY